MSDIVAFLRGSGADHRGRTLPEILAHDDAWLEATHDYIQWLFPLSEPSQNHPSAPVLTSADIAAARTDVAIQQNVRAAATRLTDFYRLTSHWLEERDHNHLRITRILRSLRLLGLEVEAEQFYNLIMERVLETGIIIAPNNLAYWTDAMQLSVREQIK